MTVGKPATFASKGQMIIQCGPTEMAGLFRSNGSVTNAVPGGLWMAT